MKRLNTNPNYDQKWAWPEKTWFRERLNAIKAREREAQHKPAETSKDPVSIETQSDDDSATEEH